MKRNIILYSLLSLVAVLLAGVAVFGFVKGSAVTGGIFSAMTGIWILNIIATAARDALFDTCVKLFEEKRFDEERKLLEKKMKSPFYFLLRITVIQHYISVCAALDDLSTSKRYIDSIRHGGGTGWKYRTAYLYILIMLDEGNIQVARTEYNDFRRDCQHAEVYKGQLEVLQAIFAQLFTLRDSAPLPEAAVGSSFPVVNRILGRCYEAQADSEDWQN